MRRLLLCAVAPLLAVLSPAAPLLADTIDLGRGPVTVRLPASYDGSRAVPVLMLLHGYGSSGASVEAYLRFGSRVDADEFIYLFPDGSRDAAGNRFWNATDACCNFFGSTVDDSAYLRALLDEVARRYRVDAGRVYVFGHSNGGFMAYRMACEHADAIAAIGSLAGATYLNESRCAPSRPVHVLQVHGTSDTVIRYGGGCLGGGCYPGAVESVETWAAYGGCEVVGDTSAPPLDLESGIAGAETRVTSYEQGCGEGGSGTLWTIQGGAHAPRFNADFTRLVMEHFYARGRTGACAADFNQDGVADADDFFDFLNAFYAGEGRADVNGDGVVDSDDFLDFFNLFLVGC